MKHNYWLAVLILINTLPLAASQGLKSVRRAAREWTVTDWFNSEPLTLRQLTGRVVLVRWWTGPACPYCQASAPALNQWHHDYKDKGLVVLGFYHHKSSRPLKLERVKQYARGLGFEFPVAIDRHWRTLEAWWLKPYPNARFTSVSFLLDRRGMIRFIHPGGQYVTGEPDFAALESRIKQLLAEPAN